MDYTFFMLPLSVVDNSKPESDGQNNFIQYNGVSIYRLHVVGSVVFMETNYQDGSGYFILDDTFSTILVHFEGSISRSVSEIKRWDLVEVLGTIDTNGEKITLALNTIVKIGLSRYSFNKIQSIKNMMELSK
ncbi:MAG: hypothetical protein ACP5MT_02775 [Candidatus Acidifodinimicrobium sp.]